MTFVKTNKNHLGLQSLQVWEQGGKSPAAATYTSHLESDTKNPFLLRLLHSTISSSMCLKLYKNVLQSSFPYICKIYLTTCNSFRSCMVRIYILRRFLLREFPLGLRSWLALVTVYNKLPMPEKSILLSPMNLWSQWC